jgi:hypothetical protein
MTGIVGQKFWVRSPAEPSFFPTLNARQIPVNIPAMVGALSSSSYAPGVPERSEAFILCNFSLYVSYDGHHMGRDYVHRQLLTLTLKSVETRK